MGYRRKEAFLDTAISVNASTTKTNGTDFTSNNIRVAKFADDPNHGSISVKFTRSAGKAFTVDFHFEVSYDGGTTWARYDSTIMIPTNTVAVSGNEVVYTKQVQWYGISHIRLHKVVNNDDTNNLTLVNAELSL